MPRGVSNTSRQVPAIKCATGAGRVPTSHHKSFAQLFDFVQASHVTSLPSIAMRTPFVMPSMCQVVSLRFPFLRYTMPLSRVYVFTISTPRRPSHGCAARLQQVLHLLNLLLVGVVREPWTLLGLSGVEEAISTAHGLRVQVRDI